MRLNYKIFVNGTTKTLGIQIDSMNAILEDYLETEITSELGRDLVIEHIIRVKSNLINIIDGVGDLYGIEINSEKTRIYNYYAEEQVKRGVPYNDDIEIKLQTDVFQKIINIWYDSLSEYRKLGGPDDFLQEGFVE